MPLRRLALVAAVVAVSWGYAAAQARKAEVKISISADKPTVKSGSDISIHIVMKNTSDHELSCMSAYADNHVDISFLYRVTGPSGKPVSKRVPKYPVLPRAGSIYPCMFGPGKSTSPRPSLISNIFNMTEPGTYTIQVLRHTTEDSWVRSNVIHVTVTP